MAQTFTCPSCGAPLDYNQAEGLTVRCAFCDNTIVIPEELQTNRPKQAAEFVLSSDLPQEQRTALIEIAQDIKANRKIQAIKRFRETFGVGLKEAKEAVEAMAAGQAISLNNEWYKMDRAATTYRARRSAFSGGCLIAGLMIVLIATAFLFFVPGLVGDYFGLATNNPVAQEPGLGPTPTPRPTPTNTPLPTPTPAFAQMIQTFGDEGIGPGRFDDARHIAVDGAGNIYVAEWKEGSRVQIFNPSGEFVSLWTPADTEAIVTDLAVDRQGIVYLIQARELARYDGATGELLGQVTYNGQTRGFEAIATAADNGLVAAWRDGFQDDLIRFDGQGNITQTLSKAISEQTGDIELSPHLAVDGLGNIYILGDFAKTIFKFGPDGKFVTKFGSHGNAPGQFGSPNDIAVDGLGRVYIGDSRSIHVFANDGRYLDTFEYKGHSVASALAFNDKDELFVAARTTIIKFALNKE